jgi:hypothetical protein
MNKIKNQKSKTKNQMTSKMSVASRSESSNDRRSSTPTSAPAKLKFYVSRRRRGDLGRIAQTTGYSVSHLSNIIAGRRSVNRTIANAMYSLSRRRQRTSEMA